VIAERPLEDALQAGEVSPTPSPEEDVPHDIGMTVADGITHDRSSRTDGLLPQLRPRVKPLLLYVTAMTTNSDRVVATTLERRTNGDRRAGRTRVHFPERRRGFDRRSDPTTRRTRAAYHRLTREISESPKRAAALMASIVALNAADIVFTFGALDRGIRELNPVMVTLLDAGHGIAAFVKIGVCAVLAVAGWWYRRFRRVIEVALFVAALMSLLVVYHLLSLG
jgi:hypothetical protein